MHAHEHTHATHHTHTNTRDMFYLANKNEIIGSFLFQIPDDSGDIIVNKAIELWQKHGCLLLPVSTRGNSPIIIDKVYSWHSVQGVQLTRCTKYTADMADKCGWWIDRGWWVNMVTSGGQIRYWLQLPHEMFRHLQHCLWKNNTAFVNEYIVTWITEYQISTCIQFIILFHHMCKILSNKIITVELSLNFVSW